MNYLKASYESELIVSRSNVSSHVIGTRPEIIYFWNYIQECEWNNLIVFLGLWAFEKVVPNFVFPHNVKQQNGWIEKSK